MFLSWLRASSAATRSPPSRWWLGNASTFAVGSVVSAASRIGRSAARASRSFERPGRRSARRAEPRSRDERSWMASSGICSADDSVCAARRSACTTAPRSRRDRSRRRSSPSCAARIGTRRRTAIRRRCASDCGQNYSHREVDGARTATTIARPRLLSSTTVTLERRTSP